MRRDIDYGVGAGLIKRQDAASASASASAAEEGDDEEYEDCEEGDEGYESGSWGNSGSDGSASLPSGSGYAASGATSKAPAGSSAGSSGTSVAGSGTNTNSYVSTLPFLERIGGLTWCSDTAATVLAKSPAVSPWRHLELLSCSALSRGKRRDYQDVSRGEVGSFCVERAKLDRDLAL